MPNSKNKFRREYKFSLYEILSYCLVGLIGLALAIGIFAEKQEAQSAAQKRFIETSRQATVETSNKIIEQFKQIYQGMRTLARLPAIRNIDRYGKNFEINARISAQEIYNNLAENVALSEIYIVPVDFEPDRIDPITGELQEPIATLDNLIVGRNADGEHGGHSEKTDPEHPEIAEIEIFEYRLMRQQLAVLKSRFGLETSINGLEYPAISGKEVITCDNTRYSRSQPNDDQRKGLVYSVPFYRKDGRIGGMVSAVILTPAIRDLLDGTASAIVNPEHDYVTGSRDSDLWVRHLADVKAGQRVEDLIYSYSINLPIREISGEWKIWAGLDDKNYWSRTDVINAHGQANLRLVSLLMAIFAILFFLRINFARQRTAQVRSDQLEHLVEKRTNDLRRAQEKSEAANRAKSTFLANMSHDIRTPISGIIGLADILNTRDLGHDEKKKIGSIYQSGKVLLDLINNILDLSKIEAGHVDISREVFSPHALVDQCVSMFTFQAEEKGLSIAYEHDDDIPKYVEGDFKHLRQVLINLIGNAIKFTDEGGVQIHISRVAVPTRDGVALRFEVRDSGIGIQTTDLNDICSAFYREKQEDDRRISGTGLGLTIAQNLIEKMGGKLKFVSPHEKGTKFYFELMFKRRTEENLSPQVIGSSETDGQGSTLPDLNTLQAQILIVEDNLVNLEIAKSYLELQGCHIDVARNGLEAIELFDRKKFDLIFMDCKMPEMDGLQATRIIREKENISGSGHLPIVALTANAFKEDRQNCLEIGMDDFLAKPFSALDLRNMLEKHLSAGND